MWGSLCIVFCWTILVAGQTNNYQQCAANLACSINYEKIFQEKINNLGYHTTLQLQTLKHAMESNIVPLTHDIEILKTNTTAIQDNVTRELQHILQSLDHDRVFLNNLTQGIYELANELHHEQYVRFHDIRKLIEEVNIIKQSLGLMNNHSNPSLESTSCEVRLNGTMHNATFFEKQYKKILAMYNNLQTTVHDIRKQQHVLITQLQEKTREVNHLQTQLLTSSPSPVRMSRNTNCGDPIGMEDGRILDTALSASESFGSFNPEYGRLNDGRGWYTGAKSTSQDWLEINLNTSHIITAVAIQGAPCCEVWVTNYTLQYSNDGQHWKDYKQDCTNKYMSGNRDQDKIVYQQLNPPIVSQYIRFNIIYFHKKNNSGSNYIGMRTELYGCPLSIPKIIQPHH